MARVSWWKVLGAAGVVGVAATGVLVARQERAKRAYSPQEIRDRLHERYAALEGQGAAGDPQVDAADPEKPVAQHTVAQNTV